MMKFSWQETFTATMVLFAVIDIIGSLPIIIQIKQRAGKINPIRTTAVSLGIMIAFLLLGEKILSVIGIGVNSFAVAGSFVLFAMALEMILGVRLFHDDEGADIGKTASVVPLAFPIIAGAGTMTSLISLRAEFAFINIALAIIINLIIVYIVLRITGRLEKALGSTGIAILRKVFGVILMAIAVKLLSANVTQLF